MKTLYRLKQSGRKWNIELDTQLGKHRYQRIHSDPCVYIQKTPDGMILITVWVDNILIFMTSIRMMEITKCDLQEAFKVTDLGEPSKIVGIKITCD